MNWERIKDKILIFGEDDYIFADMFISIINEYEKVQNFEDLKFFTYSMLTELMDEKLIKIYVPKIDKGNIIQIIEYICNDKKSELEIIKIIDNEWKYIDYKIPQPNELFWITTDLKKYKKNVG